MAATLWTKISDVASLQPVIVPPEATLRNVADVMARHDIGAVIVGTLQRPLGLVSERDIALLLARGADPDVVRAAAVMSPDLIALQPDDAVYDAAVDMLDLGIRHVAVTDRQGKVVGMISVRDLLRPLVVSALEHAPR